MNKVYFTYLRNLVPSILYKLRYGKKIKLSMLQCFNSGLKIVIRDDGEIHLGAKTENRERLYLLAAGGKIEIGNHCFFNINCCITSIKNIRIGNDCKFGNNVVIVDHDHNYKHLTNDEFISDDVVIGDRVWIGANAVILRGTVIGNDAVIAAGSVVKGHVEEGMLYLGRKKQYEI